MHRTLVSLIAAGALLVAAPGAHAAANRSFDFKTPVFVNDGTAHTNGLASFKSAKRVVLTGRVNDLCPQDGYGAYLDVTANRGSYSPLRYTARDVGGCKDKDGVAYSFDIQSGVDISSLRLKLYECDQGGTCGGYGNEKIVTIENPLN